MSGWAHLAEGKPLSGSAIFLRLDCGSALGADDLQWIIYKARRKNAPPPNADFKAADSKPVSFVSSTKEILLRGLHENGVHLGIEAQAALARYPTTFKAWKAAQSASASLMEAVQ